MMPEDEKIRSPAGVSDNELRNRRAAEKSEKADRIRSTDKGEENEQTLETVKILGPELICVTHSNISEDHFKQNHGAAIEIMR